MLVAGAIGLVLCTLDFNLAILPATVEVSPRDTRMLSALDELRMSAAVEPCPS